ncbi:protein translocase subunit SecF [Sesbania bispinosa]|nr:protein translocase subunit SecF [Sesbania bispinosa]
MVTIMLQRPLRNFRKSMEEDMKTLAPMIMGWAQIAIFMRIGWQLQKLSVPLSQWKAGS